MATAGIRSTNRMSKGTGRRWFETLVPWAFAVPALVLLFTFTYYPLLSSFKLSFYDWNFVSPTKTLVGMHNYVRVLGSRDFWQATENTALYALGLIPLTVLLPLVVANVLANLRSRLTTFYKVAAFTPAIVSFAVASVLWLFILNPVNGLANLLLQRVGLPRSGWLSDPHWVIWGVLLISGWKTAGYNMVIYLAGLTGISKDVQEAALIDGTDGWTHFWRITWPLVSPSTYFVLLTTVLNATQNTLIPIQMLTDGGPNQASTNLIFLVYQYGFRFFDMGYAAAVAVITFLVFLGLTVLQQKLLERYVHYES